ncbi:MAG: EAL domain-containing protein [Halarcobacter sp.]
MENVLNELKEYKRILNESDIVSITDEKGMIKYVNDKFCDISGYSRDELIGRPQNIVRHPDMPKSIFKELWDTVNSKKTYKNIIKNRKKDGTSYYVDATISPILDTDGNIIEIIGIRHDITDVMNPKRQLLDDLKHVVNPILVFIKIANYDILKEFYTSSMMQEFQKEFSNISLSYFPEKFKMEKVYILENGLFAYLKNDIIDIKDIKSSLKEVLINFENNGVLFEDNIYDIDVVISYSRRKKDIYDDVDLGIEYAINQKQDIVCSTDFFNAAQLESRNKLKTIKIIKEALKTKGKIISFFQPIIDNKTLKIEKYESLIRLVDKKDNVLTPYHFLDLAKKTGYYQSMTLKVIENAIETLKYSKSNISINLSASDIETKKIRDLLLELISKKQNKGRITFELLEDENVNNMVTVKEFISLSKKVGDVKIAIDDFGSGYSNFERINDFQPDYVKIDGSLIKNVIESEFSRSIVEAIVIFAKKNNIQTIAEFVSDEKIFQYVKGVLENLCQSDIINIIRIDIDGKEKTI